jgi:hypothetical protein
MENAEKVRSSVTWGRLSTSIIESKPPPKRAFQPVNEVRSNLRTFPRVYSATRFPISTRKAEAWKPRDDPFLSLSTRADIVNLLSFGVTNQFVNIYDGYISCSKLGTYSRVNPVILSGSSPLATRHTKRREGGPSYPPLLPPSDSVNVFQT